MDISALAQVLGSGGFSAIPIISIGGVVTVATSAMTYGMLRAKVAAQGRDIEEMGKKLDEVRVGLARVEATMKERNRHRRRGEEEYDGL